MMHAHRLRLAALVMILSACARNPDTYQSLATTGAPAAVGPYSQAVIANGMLYSAGQLPLDPQSGQLVSGDVGAQTDRVLANLAAILKARGAGWRDVVKTTIYLADLRDFPRVNEVYGRVLGDARPARSTVQVVGIPRGALIEIDLVALLPR